MSETEHRQIFDSLGAYALGALPEAERAAAASHIESCPICAEDAAALQRAATRLIDLVPMQEPSAALRDRIMAVVEPEAALLRAASAPPAEPERSRSPRLATWLDGLSLRVAAGAAALLIAGVLVGGTTLGGSGSPDTRTLSADVGRGHAWVELADGRAHLVVDGLALPDRGRVYEIWVQHADEPPRPASDTLADAVFVVRSGRVDIPAHLESGDRVMVTAEPSGGSRSPTTTPVVITARV